jgi:hypothetical protein
MAQIRRLSFKRPNYFNYQLLVDEDFKAEQQYHVALRRLHNRALHTWGVVDGLEIERANPKQVRIQPGLAIDNEGREIVLREPEVADFSEFSPDTRIYLTLAYDEGTEDVDRYVGEVDDFSRWSEFAVLDETAEHPPRDGSLIVLGRVHLGPDGQIHEIDYGARQAAGARIGPQTVGTVELADESVTLPKLHPALRHSLAAKGWVRLTFKPAAFDPETDFRLGTNYVTCDARGARGSMTIPVPAGATQIKRFRVTGRENTKTIKVELWRTTWNAERGHPERISLLERVIQGQPFHQTWDIPNPVLNPEVDAIAIYLEASSSAEVWSVAAEFE